ncbi:MAG TPA: NAD(P)-binding domain-containing protein [Thiobacillaceae bacterium]|nr:NAD(P)-binding domain-containing protein [Thiobacillaceae bacterium]
MDHTDTARLGFIGLGAMGRPMALNLCRAGHRLTVFARRREQVLPVLEAGALAARSINALVGAGGGEADSSAVLTVLERLSGRESEHDPGV